MKLTAIFLMLAGALAPMHAQTRYYGAVDLGSKGTKGQLYSFAKEAEGPDARVLFNKSINTTLVSGATSTKVADGSTELRFTPKGIGEAADAVKQLMDQMHAEAQKRKLATVEYYVVGSSGVARGVNKSDLAAAVRAAAGLDMDFVDARGEADFGLKSAIPKTRRDKAMLVDIGSGNTKLGCMVGGNLKSAEIPYGSVSLRNAGKEAGGADIKTGIEQVIATKVSPAYKQESMNYPCLANRERIYWIGGAAWATATFTHPEKALTGFVVITRRDVDGFLAKLAAGAWPQRKAPVFPKEMDIKEQKAILARADADRDDVQNVFAREDLVAGLNIMKAVLDASNPMAAIVFARNGNYLYGYALDHYTGDRESAGAASRPLAGETKYYGAVDLGSKGTKGQLYSFAREAEGPDARVLFNKSINTTLISGATNAKAADGSNELRFTPKGIGEAADAVKQLMDQMHAEAQKRGLPAVEYYVVGSSGVAKGANGSDLSAAVKAAAGLDMAFVDARGEAQFGLDSAIPKTRRAKAMLVDIGSGNTKLGCMVGDGLKSAEIAYGSVSLRNAGKEANPADIKAGIEQVIASNVSPAYKKESMNYPCLANRERIYWIGGAAWATATFMHPEKALTGFVVITRSDVDTFLAKLADGSWTQRRAPVFPKEMDLKEKTAIQTRADADRDDVQNVFAREDLLAGLNVMKAVLDASNPMAAIVFARNGNYLYGYALDRYKENLEIVAADFPQSK